MLSLKNFSIKRGENCVVDGVNLDFAPKKIYAILGPNGAGKSSFIRGIFGELRFCGEVFLGGEKFSHKKGWKKHFGYMPQDIGIDVNLSALEVVLLGNLDELGVRVSDEQLFEALGVMEYLGIAHLANRDISSLSGGQRQMVFFAQVLLKNPKVLLLDEPVSALDMHHQCVLLDCLRKQTREKELITLVILHDLSLASEFCDEIIFLHHSRIWARGLPSQILEHSLLQDIYKVNAKIFYDDRGTPAVIAKSAILEELR